MHTSNTTLSDQPISFDCIVLGAGAAGLFCAAVAGQRGKRVLVLEHGPTPGRKILISGGGRCNFTNRDLVPNAFLSENPHFAKSALARYGPAEFLALVERYGIAWHEKELGQLFCDGSAQQVLDMLLEECRLGQVTLQCGERVEEVRQTAGFTVQTSQGLYAAPALVVATGGLSIPKLGASPLAYQLAEQFGLRVVRTKPGLVPFVFSPKDQQQFDGLAGVAVEAEVRCGKSAFRNKLLFTHRGLSGPAVLQASSYWQDGDAVQLDWLPGRGFARSLLARKQNGDRANLATALSAHFPQRLAARLAPPVEQKLMHVADKEIRGLEEALHHFRFIPAGTEGFAKAEVTVGGVDTKDLSSQTLGARNVPGLFFIGECVDVTGWLGGYNFQWAWSSAHACAMAL